MIYMRDIMSLSFSVQTKELLTYFLILYRSLRVCSLSLSAYNSVETY